MAEGKNKKRKSRFWNLVFGTKGAIAFPVGAGSDSDFYDDCPLCQLLKRAKKEGREPSEEELKKACREAGEQGVIVGGDWLEKDKK